MTLNEAIDLVLFAFYNGNSGDIFVQKAPASTIGTLANVMLDIFNSNLKINIIGTRHGEKLYESLLTREEFAVADDMGSHYRIKADNRDLNYGKFYEEGNKKLGDSEEYHSHNAYRLKKEELKKILLNLDYISNLIR